MCSSTREFCSHGAKTHIFPLARHKSHGVWSAGTTGDAASMRQATEALARNAAYRPNRIKFPETRSPSRNDRAPVPRQVSAKTAPAQGAGPANAAGPPEREAAARTVIRAVEGQQRADADRARTELTASQAQPRPTNLQLAQAQAQARKAEVSAQQVSGARFNAPRNVSVPADAAVKVTATRPPEA